MATVLILVWAQSKAWPIRAPDPDFPSDLQYGIRWFTRKNVRTAGYDTPPPLPDAPTIILVHGWQPGTCKIGTGTSQLMVNFNYLRIDSKYGVNENLADAWLDKGWNVGIFYWTPFADEDRVQDAEDKIWSPNGGPGMRWRMNDEFHTDRVPANATIADLFLASYRKVFTNSTKAQGPITVLGHSIGSQVVGRATLLMHQLQLPLYLLPSQVVLLDPYMSSEAKSYLSDATVGSQILAIWGKVLLWSPSLAVSIFQSSDANFISGNGNTDEYDQLVKKVTMVRLHSGWIALMDMNKIGNQHVAAAAIYMKSVQRSDAPGAGANASEMKKLMGKGLYLQTDGGETFDADDDVFTVIPWTEPFTGPSLAAFFTVWVALAIMVFTSLTICLCCGCCVYRHGGKCTRSADQDQDTQDFTYRSATW